MKKPSSIQISIPSPCSQSWDEMTPNANGRFCSHCQETVIDFTGYSDKSLFNFLAIKQGPICGRFNATQLQRQISIPPQPHSRLYRMFIALGMTLLFTNLPDAHSRPCVISCQMQELMDGAPEKNGNDSVTIRGLVLDANKEPLVGALIDVRYEGTSIAKGISDADGKFIVMVAKGLSEVDIMSTFASYETKKITQKLNYPNSTCDVNIQMETRTTTGLMDIQIINYKTPLMNPYDPSKKVIDGETIEKAPTTR